MTGCPDLRALDLRRRESPIKPQQLICLAIGHGYTDKRVYSDEEAQYSVCKRCGHRRYKPPSDFLGREPDPTVSPPS